MIHRSGNELRAGGEQEVRGEAGLLCLVSLLATTDLISALALTWILPFRQLTVFAAGQVLVVVVGTASAPLIAVLGLPLLVLSQAPELWLLYAAVLLGASGLSACSGRRWWRLLAGYRPGVAARRSGATSLEPGSGRTRVYLLTSHPVAPPWNGADKNLARMLLDAEVGVDFTFMGDAADTTEWPHRHGREALRFRSDMPTAREKLRLFTWLCLHSLTVDVVHAIVTFQRNPLSQWGLLALPQLRHHRLLVTCLSGHYLPLDLLQRARIVVAVSRSTERRLSELGIRDVRLISPGVELDFFQPRPAELARRELKLGPEPALLFAGHYDRDGGLDAALELTSRLRLRVPNLRLLLAMRTRPGYRDLQRQARTRAVAAKLGLTGSIVELGSSANMRAALQASSAVIFQPRSLGMKMDLPMTLLEALACGRPLVVSRADSLGELADHSPAVAVEDPASEASIDHLERLLTDREYASECETAARRLAERRFSAGPMLAAYSAIYRELASEVVHVGDVASQVLRVELEPVEAQSVR